MIIKAKFIGLYKLNEKDALDLLSEHFNTMFDIEGYDILKKIDQYLVINYYMLPDRDKFKDKFRQILLDSKVKITDKNIIINGQDIIPSISNWLKDFRGEFTENGFLDKMKLNQYLLESDNIANLTNVEKYKVKTLLNLYSKLKIKSSSPEGIEETIPIKKDNGEFGFIKNGQFQKASQEIINIYNQIQKLDRKKVSKGTSQKVFTPEDNDVYEKDIEVEKYEKESIEKLLESYRNFEKNLSSTKNLSKQFEKYKNDIDKLSSEFETSLNQGNKDKAWAIILFVCENELLNLFFKENTSLILEFKKYLSSRFHEDIIDNIIQKSDSPETVSLYLQFLLNNKLKFSIKSSGLFGMHLANIFKKIGKEKYFPIVYGDLNLEQFVWIDIVEEAGKCDTEVVKSFKGIKAGKTLKVDLVSRKGNTIISGIEIIQEKYAEK